MRFSAYTEGKLGSFRTMSRRQGIAGKLAAAAAVRWGQRTLHRPLQLEDKRLAEPRDLERRTVHYAGRVQGVGFRYETRSLANQFDVTGYVQNLDDGRVLLVVEGSLDEMDRFLGRIAESMRRHIRNVTSLSSPATGEFTEFRIER
jgi:acylphosphatase